MHWEFWFGFLKDNCLHGTTCARRSKEGVCHFGSRLHQKYLISGAVLPVLHTIFAVVQSHSSGDRKKAPRALRAKTVDGELLVGLNLQRHDAESVLLQLTT